MAQDFPNGIDLTSTGRVSHVLDPAVSTDGSTKNYTDTTTSAIYYGGWGDADSDVYGDLLSTFPRNYFMLLGAATGGTATTNVQSISSGNQNAYLWYNRRAFTSTGFRYVTGSSSATSGNTVTATIYTGTSLAAMVLQTTVAAPFTTTSTFTQVGWGSSVSVPVGWVAVVFTCTAGATPKFAAVFAQPYGGTFTNPSGTAAVSIARTSASLPSTLDFTSGWSANTIQPWLAMY
jgi:hypothetical protein